MDLFCLEVSLGRVHVALHNINKGREQPEGYGLVFQFLDFQPLIMECNNLLCSESHCTFNIYKGKSCIFEAAAKRLESELQLAPSALSVLLVSGLAQVPRSDLPHLHPGGRGRRPGGAAPDDQALQAGRSLQLIASNCVITNYGDATPNRVDHLDLHDALGQVVGSVEQLLVNLSRLDDSLAPHIRRGLSLQQAASAPRGTSDAETSSALFNAGQQQCHSITNEFSPTVIVSKTPQAIMIPASSVVLGQPKENRESSTRFGALTSISNNSNIITSAASAEPSESMQPETEPDHNIAEPAHSTEQPLRPPRFSDQPPALFYLNER